MAKREIGTSLKLDGEAQFKAAITNINQELRVLSSEMGAAVSAFDKSGASVSDLKAKGDIYERQLESQKEKLSVLQNAVETAREAQAKAAQTAAEMAEKYGENSDEAKKASEAVAGITKKLNDYQIQANNTTRNINQLEAAQRANNEEIAKMKAEPLIKLTEQFKKLATEAGKAASETAKIAAKTFTSGIEAGVKALTAYTGAVTGTATAVAGLGKKAVDVGKSFESGMSQVAATMGITVDEINSGSESFEMLEKAAKEAGASTQFSASEASEALNYLALAGYSAEEASAALPNVLNLAAAGGMDLASASDLATDACSALGMGVDDLDTLMDKMARSAQKSNMSVSQVGEATLVCAGTATSFGMELSAMNANLGVLANNGIKGAEGGTHLRNVLLSLSAPTDTAAAQLEKLGVAVAEDGKFRDLNDIIKDLDSSLSELSDEEKLNALSTIFNKTDITAVNALLKGCGEEYENLKNEIENADGAAADMAETMLNNLDGSLTILNSSLEGTGIQLYELAEGTIKTAVNDIQGIVSGFSAALGDGGIEGAVQYIQDIIPTIGKNLVNGISDMLPAFLEGFNGVVLAIVQALSETLPAAISGILQPLLNGMLNLVNGLVQEIPSFVPILLDGAVTLFFGILDGLNQVIAQITPMLPQIVSDISGTLAENIPALISGAAEFFAGIVSAIAVAAPSIIEAAVELVPLICNSIIENIPLLIDAGLQLFVSLTEALPDAVVQIIVALPQIIDGIIRALLEAIPQINQAGFDLLVALIYKLPDIIVELVKAVPKILSGFVDGFKEKMSTMSEIGSNLIAGIGDGLIEGVSAVKDKINSAGEKIMNSFKEFFGIHSPSTKMKEEVGFNLADGVSEGFTEQMGRNTAEMSAAVPKNYTIGVNITDEKTAKKAIDTIVTDYKKGRLSQRQADALTVSVYRECEQQKIQITEYALEKITAARKDVSDKNREQLEKDLKSEISAYEKQAEAIQKSIQKTADNLTESYKSMYTFEKDEDGNIISAKTTNKIRNATKELDDFNAEVEKLMEKGVSGGLLNQLDGMSRDEGAAVAEYWNTLSDKELKALERNWQKYNSAANKLSERLHAEETEKAARDMLENLNGVITDSSAELDDMGLQIMAGLREGMTGEAAGKQIKEVCDSIISRFKEYFGIASPSKIMKKEIGLNLADGVGEGFTEQMSRVSADMKKSVPTNFDLDVEVDAAATARRRYGTTGGNGSGGFSYTQIINSPKALDTAEINRRTKQGLQLAAVMK